MITLQERVHGASPPADWQANKLRNVLHVRRGMKNTGMQEDNLLSLSYGRIIRKDIDANEGLLPESFETYQIVEPGNIVMRLTDLQNDKRSIRQGLVTERGIITSAYDALEVAKDHDPRFWAYALLALDLAKYYYSLGAGVRQSIKFADFPNDWIRTPNLETQKCIADFLDRETVRIDQLVEKKKRLTEILSEKFSAQVTNLIEGDDWESIRLSRMVRFVDGDRSSEYPSDSDLVEDGIPFFSSKQIKNRHLTLDEAKFISEKKFRNLGRGKLQDGDMIVTVRGTLGNTAIFHRSLAETGFINAQLMILRPLSAFSPDLLHFFTRSSSWATQIEIESYGSAQKQLNQDILRRFVVRYPLGSSIDYWITTTNTVIDRHKRLASTVVLSIDRLREFRSALVTAAVTGQIDVVNWGKHGQTDRRLDRIEEAMRA